MGLLSELFSNIKLFLNDDALPRRSALRVISNRVAFADNPSLQTSDLDLRPLEASSGATVVYQPGGIAGGAVVTSEGDIQTAIDAAIESGALAGGGKLVIDGTYGTITFGLGNFNLWGFFDVEFVSISTITVSCADGTALFINPRSKIVSDVPLIFIRSGTNGVYLAQFDGGITFTGSRCRFENLIWYASASNPRPFARVRRGGICRLNFINCGFATSAAFSPLTLPGSDHSIVWVQDTAPSSFIVSWHGTTAGIVSNEVARLFYTTLGTVGFTNLTVIYNPALASADALDWTGMDWASGTPTLINI